MAIQCFILGFTNPFKSDLLSKGADIAGSIVPGAKDFGEQLGTSLAYFGEKAKGLMGGQDNSQFIQPTDFSKGAKGVAKLAGTGAGVGLTGLLGEALLSNADITMAEKGKYISFANCGLPYYTGGTIESRNSILLHTKKTFKDRFNVDVLPHTEAVDIDTAKKIVLFIS